LGAGQFGEVWRARSPGDAHVALKVLPLGGAHGWKEFRAVQRVKQIRHPNLMPIIAIWLLDEDGDVISDDVLPTLDVKIDETTSQKSSRDTLVIEPVRESRKPARMIIANLLADKTLGDRLKECQAKGVPGIPQQELLRYMEEAAKGLDFLNFSLHQIGDSHGSVQHCDVKPDNIMLTGGSAIVSDFGVAQMMAEANSGVTATSLGGTPAYMAPECFESKTSTGTDQYALAVTYYELRTGKLPFERQTYAAVYEAHRSGTLDFSAVSEGERSVLRKATSPAPERRYASCLDFVTALRESAGLYPTVRASSRKRAISFTLIAAVSVAAVGVFALLLGKQGEAEPVEQVHNFVRQREYKGAAFLVRSFDDPKDISAALKLIVEQLDKEAPTHQLDNEHLGELISLLASVRSAPQNVDAELVGRLGVRINQQLEMRAQEIRDGLDAWTSNEASSINVEQIPERIELLSGILAKNAATSGLPECEQFRTSIPVLNVRVMARGELASYPELRLQLPETVHQRIESHYAAALKFILSANRSDANDPNQKMEIQHVANRLRDCLNLYSELSGFRLAAWEQRQIEAELKDIDKAIRPEWLANKEFQELVVDVGGKLKLLPDSYEAARDPVKNQLKEIARLRREGQFPKAWKLIELIPGDATEKYQNLARDERALLTLLDPSCPPRQVDQLLAEDMERLRRLLNDVDAIDPQSVRAPLISAIKAECRIVGQQPGEAPPELPLNLSETISDLVGTDFDRYARYVGALNLAWQARAASEDSRGQIWEDASDELRAVYTELPTGSPLATADRKRQTRRALLDAVSCWSGARMPTDADYGKPEVLDQRALHVYRNLRFARELQPTSDDQLLRAAMLCSAVMAWEEVIEEHEPESLLSMANGLLSQAQSESSIHNLLGTIYCAQCKAQMLTEAAPEAQLESAANALSRLYLAGGLDPKSDLQSEQLKWLWIDLVDPLLPLADELWRKHEQAPDAGGSTLAILGQFYRAAGFLLREPSIAGMVRLAGKRENANRLPSLAMERANRVRATAMSLIAEGRLLCELWSSDPNLLTRLTKIAGDAVVAASDEGSDDLKAQALALQSYAFLEQARDERQPLQQRLSNYKEALAQIDEAIALHAAAPKKPPEYAEWMGNRATIQVHYAFHANLPAGEREKVLTAAAEYASNAAALGLTQNGHYPYLAWGNALEDLALYLWIEPERNYELACNKFAKALETAHPGVVSLQYAKHLSSLMSLVRCRNRRVSSGVLGSKEQELELLRQSLDDVRDNLPLFDPQNVPNDLSPSISSNVAELLYVRSETHHLIAARTSGPARDEALRSAFADAASAVRWASHYGAWEAWADYQIVAAARQYEAGDAEAAARACQEVLSLKEQHGVDLPPHTLCRTAEKLLSYRQSAKKNWSSAEWDALLARLSSADPITSYCYAFLEVLRISTAATATDAEVQHVDDLVRAIRAESLPRQDDLNVRARWAAYRGDRSLKLAHEALQQKEWAQFITHSQHGSAYYQEALAMNEAAVSESLLQTLKVFQSGKGALSNLRGWERKRLAQHLQSTLAIRRNLVDVNSSLLKIVGSPLAPGLNADELQKTVEQQANLLKLEVL
jgi:serine/threonine protein kinase